MNIILKKNKVDMLNVHKMQLHFCKGKGTPACKQHHASSPTSIYANRKKEYHTCFEKIMKRKLDILFSFWSLQR